MKTLVAMVAAFVFVITAAQAQAALTVRQLVRQADFVGIVQAEPNGPAPSGEWRQDIFLMGVEAIKGSLTRNINYNNQYPWIKADHAGFAGYPTRFDERGEYLVFLHRLDSGVPERWTTLAAYQVQYSPDGLNRTLGLEAENVIGLLTSGSSIPIESSPPAVTITDARRGLAKLVIGQPLAERDETRINAFFRASLLSKEDSLKWTPPTHEERLALAKKLAAEVMPGMTRAQVEKIFPESTRVLG